MNDPERTELAQQILRQLENETEPRAARIALAFDSPRDAGAVQQKLHPRAHKAIRTITRTLDDGRTVLLVFTKTGEQTFLHDVLSAWCLTIPEESVSGSRGPGR